MPVIAVIGAQWGDEGKGKIVDMLAEKADVVVRYSGGDNAGHTIVNSLGEFRLHLIPSGIFSPGAACIIGNGVAVNPAVLIDEMAQVARYGVQLERLYVSDRANLIMPYHILLDGLEEDARGGKALGTTRKGIGPAFSDKVARLGIRAGDLLDKDTLLERLRHILEAKNAILTKVYGKAALSLDEVYSQYCRYGEKLARHICDTTVVIDKALKEGKKILLEGAQGTLLDPDFGSYPYTTSSSPLAGGACLGAGISPRSISSVLAVFKAYVTRVGGGPMPTELHDDTAKAIRERGQEYGATTGRPRRCGWFDGVVASFSSRINGFTAAAITRLDILDFLPALKICVGYRLGEKLIKEFPASVADLARCQPVYEEVPGWQSPTSHCRKYDELPVNARRYIERLEELVCCPVNLISVGSSREQTIERGAIL